MILPNKYINFNDSMIYQACSILTIIKDNKMSFDKIWSKYKSRKSSNEINCLYFFYLLEFMYLVGMINYNENGEIFNENIENRNSQ